MGEITVSMPLSEYERLKREMDVNHVKNFIEVDSANCTKNEWCLKLNKEAIRKKFDVRPRENLHIRL